MTVQAPDKRAAESDSFTGSDGSATVLASVAIPSTADLQALQALANKFPWLFPGLDPREQKTVGEIVVLYLRNAHEDIGVRTLETRTFDLGQFCRTFGAKAVRECNPFDFKEWLFAQSNWKSAAKRGQVNVGVQRCFNWAVENRLVKENPFRGVRLKEHKGNGRDMKPEEFQALMRTADVFFRRFMIALKMTGARPSELASLTWEEIDWERGVAVKKKHKTAKKTGKPRLIVFSPGMLKLLSIIRRDQHGPAAAELRRILESRPDRSMKVNDLVQRMRELGFNYRRTYLARMALGVIHRRIAADKKNGACRHCGRTKRMIPRGRGTPASEWHEGKQTIAKFRRGLCALCYRDRSIRERYEAAPPWADGFYVYELPDNAKPAPPTNYAEKFVFLSCKGRPWTRTAWATKFKRLRAECGLPMSCKLYGLRHLFLTDGVKRGTNLKALATLVGHVDTRMIDKVYCHVDGDVDFLRTAVMQAIGQVAPMADHPAFPVPPSQNGNGSHVAAIPPASPDDGLVKLLLNRMVALEDRLQNPPPAKTINRAPKMQASHAVAYELSLKAVKENPALKTDQQIFQWLMEQPDSRAQLPPTFTTFGRYLRTARKHYLGCGKREMRRKTK